MSKKTKSTPEYIAKCQNWCRVAMCLDRHVKPALVRILHNEVNDPNINGLPSGPKMLYEYLNEKGRKGKIKVGTSKEQRNLLLPQKGEVSSESLDITLLRFLINTFIYSGNLMKPHYYDHSIAAAVYRAADMRNTVCHYSDISAMGDVQFKDIWRKIQEILDDLKYPKDEDTKKAISDLEKAPFDPEKMEKLQENMAKDFEEILLKYKEKCKDKETGIFIDRKYKHKNSQQVETNIETWLEQVKTNNETSLEQVETNIETLLEQIETNNETSLEQVKTNIKTSLEQIETNNKTLLERLETNIETSLEQVKTNNETSLEQVETNIETLLEDYDSVMVTAEAGLGKTFSARHMRDLWAADKILLNKKMLYIDSKKVNKKIYKPSNAAPICVSELGDALKDKSDKYLESFGCVKKHIRDLLVIVDGADELSIGEHVDLDFLHELEKAIDENSEISAMQTIIGIYFGLFFPGAKIVVFGRHHEIDRLIRIHDQRELSNLFNKQKRVVLELQRFEQNDVKEFISRVVCKKASCDCQKCTSTHTLVKDVELLTIPSNLMAVIRVNLNNNLMVRIFRDPHNFRRITRTIIFIITIFDKLKNHAQIDKQEDVEISFERLLKSEKTLKFPEYIQNIAKMCFFSLREHKVIVEVKKSDENDGVYFTFETIVHGDQISVKVKRDIIEQLDFFYVYDEDYNVRLEPRHLTNMEFLASCYIYNRPNEFYYLFDLQNDRKSIIFPFIVDLLSNDNLTKDFRSKVLEDSLNPDIEEYLSDLLFEHLSFPKISWLQEDGKLYPSFDLLHRTSEEAGVFDDISKKLKEVQTLVCRYPSDLEWYKMKKFKFFSEGKKYQMIIKAMIRINTEEDFDTLLEMADNDDIEFIINHLIFNTRISEITPKTKYLKCNFLRIGVDCDSRTINLLLKAISPLTETALSIQCKTLVFQDITKLGHEQTTKLFTLGLYSGCTIKLSSTFFTDKQIKILEDFERKYSKINIEIEFLDFTNVLALPKLGDRRISLFMATGINDDDLIDFKARISSGYTNDFLNYKVISAGLPFVKRENDFYHSFYLNIAVGNFSEVSSEVFAAVFSSIPSFAFDDNMFFIPSSHWSSLLEIKDSRINEIRIWRARAQNIRHFLLIKTKRTQFIFHNREDLEQFLNFVITDQFIPLRKEIKVFIVKRDFYYDRYKEEILFGRETIKEYKENYILDNALLANEPETFHEGSKDSLFCCEIYGHLQEYLDDIEF